MDRSADARGPLVAGREPFGLNYLMGFASNITLRRALLLALLIGLTACTDPLDRVQGEPSGAEPAQTEEMYGGDH